MPESRTPETLPAHPDAFAGRHLGPRGQEVTAMLQSMGLQSLDQLIDQAVPAPLMSERALELPPAQSEHEALRNLKRIAEKNKVLRSYLGMGYHGTLVPPVIQRNILENPGWYTQYTPYQAEISQGRMEALLNFQTMILDLTGLEVANSSLLDEATAAAEAMTLCQRVLGRKAADRTVFLADHNCHPQTLAVLRTRAEPLGIEVREFDPLTETVPQDAFGALVQYPDTTGEARPLTPIAERIHGAGALLVVAADPLALTLLKSPGSCGADICVGTTQRFGVPMGYGGPHAAYMACREDYKRMVPGRIIGVTIDADGNPALRLSLATREQHIRREKATSNICTAQVLLAIMASMYGVYHGPDGLRGIAARVRAATSALAGALDAAGCTVHTTQWFDTLKVSPRDGDTGAAVIQRALDLGINLRPFGDGAVGVTFDETVEMSDIAEVLIAFGADGAVPEANSPELPVGLVRDSEFMTHPVFHSHRSEHDLLRYIHTLQSRDLSLTHSMIPLGSCTMKLNATAEMVPVTWPEFGGIHPFAPRDQAAGYTELHDTLRTWLGEITGFPGVSLQPNAGAQGEYTGLLVIRAWQIDRGQGHRNICLIPSSAHGTNPASAVMAGMKVVVVRCDDEGNIDMADLTAKADEHKDNLAALMVTYPSTHGVFEESIKDVCQLIHDRGGQVYMDGANLNAQVGLMRPGDLGADVVHLNLHKTFCIPHGGGGPGMGPIGVGEHLVPFLPDHPVVPSSGDQGIGPVSAAPWGSPSILPISFAYIAMMGGEGLTEATKIAILNANYMAHRLKDHYPVLYTGQNGMVAHECILDTRPLKGLAGIEVADVAKRLMDYGFHAPTMSWPVAGTLMIEPTESESQDELDRFCDAMISIRQEVQEIADGTTDREDNLLKNAPHTAAMATATDWSHPYTRERAVFPAPWTKSHKFWPPVRRVNDVHGDRNLVCTCPPLESYES